jgi:hypothetical protein
MAIELRTERLRLTPIGPADRKALHALWTEPAVRRYLWDDRVIDLATVDDVIARSAASFAAEGFGLFALREPDGEALLGAVGIFRLREGEPELIYSLATASMGRGLASEASRAVIRDPRRLRAARLRAGPRAHRPAEPGLARGDEAARHELRERGRGGQAPHRLLHPRARGLGGALLVVLLVEAHGAPLEAERVGAAGASVEAIVDAIAARVEPVFDAFAAPIEALVRAIPGRVCERGSRGEEQAGESEE